MAEGCILDASEVSAMVAQHYAASHVTSVATQAWHKYWERKLHVVTIEGSEKKGLRS